MSRGKSGTKSKILKTKAMQAMRTAMRQFTRAKALKAITIDNCHEARFMKHRNKHVVQRAEHLMAKRDTAPDTAKEVA